MHLSRPTPNTSPRLSALGAVGGVIGACILIVGLGATALAWRLTGQAVESHARALLTSQADDIENAIAARMVAYKGLLHAGVGLIDAVWPVDERQWRTFAADMRLSAAYPGIHGIGFAAVLRSADDIKSWPTLAAHPPFAFPGGAGAHPERETAVVLLEPEDALNDQAMGLDMMSEPVRRAAMERARDEGRAALSGGVTLLQELQHSGAEPGFVLYVPAYFGEDEPQTIEARRSQLQGFVYSAFRAGEFFPSALKVNAQQTIFEVLDGETGRVLYRNARRPHASALVDERVLLIAGQPWTLRVWAGPGAALSNANVPLLVAITTAAVTLLLAMLAAGLAFSRQRLKERVALAHEAAERDRLAAEQLEQRVRERTRELAERSAQLEAANLELSTANRDLETFSYTVSHDLRAPLRAVNGHVELFCAESTSLTESQQRHLHTIRRNTSRMAEMIEDLLRLAFLSRQPLEKQQLDLSRFLAPIVEDVRRTYSGEIVVGGTLGDARADPALLRHVFANLLLNAAKFSREAAGPRIEIGAEQRSSGPIYFVRDNGVGFDMKYAGKLFGVFERLHSMQQFEGSGVGLAIVKQIVERHGGRIWAHAEPGRGATFYFTLSGNVVEMRSAA